MGQVSWNCTHTWGFQAGSGGHLTSTPGKLSHDNFGWARTSDNFPAPLTTSRRRAVQQQALNTRKTLKPYFYVMAMIPYFPYDARGPLLETTSEQNSDGKTHMSPRTPDNRHGAHVASNPDPCQRGALRNDWRRNQSALQAAVVRRD